MGRATTGDGSSQVKLEWDDEMGKQIQCVCEGTDTKYTPAEAKQRVEQTLNSREQQRVKTDRRLRLAGQMDHQDGAQGQT